MASQVQKIKVKNPVVELDGDEVCLFLGNTFPQSGCVLPLYRQDNIGTRGGWIAFGPSALSSPITAYPDVVHVRR